jgi:hypothetical protein
MNLRRRIALFLDPSLAVVAKSEPETITSEPLWSPERIASSRIADRLDQMVAILNRMERNTRYRRRPRIVDCRHPELHPDDPDAVAFLQREGRA